MLFVDFSGRGACRILPRCCKRQRFGARFFSKKTTSEIGRYQGATFVKTAHLFFGGSVEGVHYPISTIWVLKMNKMGMIQKSTAISGRLPVDGIWDISQGPGGWPC